MPKILIANWKMNLTLSQAKQFAAKLKTGHQEVILAVPFVFLAEFKKTGKKMAGQNVSAHKAGAYTGEISAKMLKDAGCAYCLVGHSERRVYFGETDADVNQKVLRLLENNIRPIICVGENLTQRKSGETGKVIKEQILTALKGVKNLEKVLIAYEPIWAISTFAKGPVKKSAETKDIIAAHTEIKRVLSEISKNKPVKILYGGTVSPANAADILNSDAVDGALVGAASLQAESFNAIIQAIK